MRATSSSSSGRRDMFCDVSGQQAAGVWNTNITASNNFFKSRSLFSVKEKTYMEGIRRKSFRLSQHALAINLIASGLVRLSEQLQQRQPIAYPSPVALPQGLNRFPVACIQKGIPPVNRLSHR